MKELLNEWKKFLNESENKKAVIVKGNPYYVEGIQKDLADKFYSELEELLKKSGYKEVIFEDPDSSEIEEADLWIGHSKGEGKLKRIEKNGEVPEGTRLIYLSKYEPGYNSWRAGLKKQMKEKGYKSWTKFISQEKPLPNKEHYLVTDKLKRAIELS